MFFYGKIMDTYHRADGRRHWIDRLLSPDGRKEKPEYRPSNQGTGTPREVARKHHQQKHHVEQPFKIRAGGHTDYKYYNSARAGEQENPARAGKKLKPANR